MIDASVRTLTRRLAIISGSREKLDDCVRQLAEQARCPVIYLSNRADISAVSSTTLTPVSCRQAQDLLGTENQLVVVDLVEEICVDAIAALSGTVIGGGMLVLCLPDPIESSDLYSSRFAKRLLYFLQQYSDALRFNLTEVAVAACCTELLQQVKPLTESRSERIRLTDDQQQVYSELLQTVDAGKDFIRCVIADRGRGKSTLLGVLAAELIQGNTLQNIIVTAPSRKASLQIFEHYQHIFSEGQVQTRSAHQQLQFRSPDELNASEESPDLLIIDEAAAIPLPSLLKLIQRVPRVILATTVHGYEGTGRGFFVRFFKWLENHKCNWQKFELAQPVRWSAEDQLEPWLFRWLCLDVEIESFAEEEFLSADNQQLHYQHVSSQTLAENEMLLRQVFALLVLAHYRTRPSDLQRLLDDDVIIQLALYNGKPVAAVIAVQEGGFDDQLAEKIYLGQRRPAGHLLAQTLCYHCAVRQAVSARVLRIMRIIVHPLLQRRGIGQQLLQQLIQQSGAQFDVIGASFGMTSDLLNFWLKNDFVLVRLGYKKEQTSGERAAVVVKALSDSGIKIVDQAAALFSRQLAWLDRCEEDLQSLSDLPVTVISRERQLGSELTQSECNEIELYINSSRQFELCIAAINKWLRINQERISQLQNFNAEFIWQSIDSSTNWKQLADQYGLPGKKQAEQHFKQLLHQAWVSLR